MKYFYVYKNIIFYFKNFEEEENCLFANIFIQQKMYKKLFYMKNNH